MLPLLVEPDLLVLEPFWDTPHVETGSKIDVETLKTLQLLKWLSKKYVLSPKMFQKIC